LKQQQAPEMQRYLSNAFVDKKEMPILLERLAGKVMLVHNARIEQGFINKICQTLYGCDFVIPTIDTQALATSSRLFLKI